MSEAVNRLTRVPAVQGAVSASNKKRPQQDSNLRTRLRRPLLYPLSYGGWRVVPKDQRPMGPEQGYQSPDRQAHANDTYETRSRSASANGGVAGSLTP